ncbi:aminoacyl-tRNA hydrolase [Anoxynatronum buryatiense]|uniref:Peptidyl-tRNA hydrolase n=1 Tax=Anoxynatronum buryatiense TaxID=489973 RepID=A0AA46AIP3_9CLOT|nr:aminoacyl-tRNA hydrolase [Anoxynatronum buryatiense]SMP51540.1 peptidyl-tRNA hydrolase [Anoxynatronum buryatiense]
MIIIAGLGNPGGKYDATRHNIGFHVIDALAAGQQTAVNQKKFKSHFTEIRVGSEKVLLVKPQTYMNLSGESIGHWMRYYQLASDRLLVVYDDMDFAPGEVRLRQKGSAGSHNGMKSIIQHLGTTEFPRLRVGIGKPLWQDAASFVLARFTPEEIPVMRDAVTTAAEAAQCFVQEGIQMAMNRYNRKPEEPVQEKPANETAQEKEANQP